MKNEKGFTLVEVIISIAALGVICAVLLRLFVLAGDTNDLTANRQAAEMAAASAAETVLCADTLQDGTTALGAAPAEADGQYTASKDGYQIALRAAPRGEGYPGVLYDICIQALKDGSVIAEINTVKYYPEEGHD
jgi:prepilin-type N-terminal cleavage/methylation domain-containing protein